MSFWSRRGLCVVGAGLALIVAGCQSTGSRTAPVATVESSAEKAPATTADAKIEAPQTEVAAPQAAVPDDSPRQVTLLHINDVYRIGGVDDGQEGGLARVRALRQQLEKEAPDLLFLHGGDLLFPSLLSREYYGEQMVDVLNLMDGDPKAFDDRMFAVFGNHEFDKGAAKDTAMFDQRIEDSGFFWLGTNINFIQDSGIQDGDMQDDDAVRGIEADHLVNGKIVESGGVKVGLFGLSTDMVHPDYVEKFLDPTTVARHWVRELRSQGAELVVALTHLPMTEDVAVLEALGDDRPDLVLGGHEHNKLKRQVGDTWILKADAEARTASVVRVTLDGSATPHVESSFAELGVASKKDEAVQTLVDKWLVAHDKKFCAEDDLPPGCLDEEYGHTNVRLMGEELEIRRYESNLGNWLVDQALAAYADQGAQIAFVNSGSFRLNQDIPADSAVQRRHIEEIFQYSSDLRRVRITGAVLQEAVNHSVANWTGEGKWMQISGFAFRHDLDAGVGRSLTLLGPDGPRPIDPDEELLAVVSDYLVNFSRDQDGYTMLTPEMVVLDENPLSLKTLVTQALMATSAEGIAPRVAGRICNVERPGPCLALEER